MAILDESEYGELRDALRGALRRVVSSLATDIVGGMESAGAGRMASSMGGSTEGPDFEWVQPVRPPAAAGNAAAEAARAVEQLEAVRKAAEERIRAASLAAADAAARLE